MRKFILFLSILILGGLVGLVAGWRLHPSLQNKNALQDFGAAPDYTLTDQLGRQVSSTAFDGKVRIVAFLFPYCTGYCPLIAHNFVSLERVLKAAGLADRVQIIAFNVDPANTGPAQMRTFQEQYGWHPEDTHWQYLTGPPDEIHRIVTGAYHISYQKVSNASEEQEIEKEKEKGTYVPEPVVSNKMADKANVDYDIVHNDALAIVDTRGRIRKYFNDANRVSNDQIMDVVYRLLPADAQAAAH
ncbi:MAG TPA: SCO family protein [Desulfuromonadales bacterium]|nr:SCO family protein [Desulfuromonadales bacterium]